MSEREQLIAAYAANGGLAAEAEDAKERADAMRAELEQIRSLAAVGMSNPALAHGSCIEIMELAAKAK